MHHEFKRNFIIILHQKKKKKKPKGIKEKIIAKEMQNLSLWENFMENSTSRSFDYVKNIPFLYN